MIINQWVPAAHRGDAIGDSARRVRDMLRLRGHTANIYALTIDTDLRNEIQPFDDSESTCGDVTILHFAVPSRMSQAFTKLPSGRILQYHNITPAHFFAPYDSEMSRMAIVGRQELAGLVDYTDLALGDSEYNRQELEMLGFKSTAVMPILVSISRLTSTATRPALEQTLSDGLTNILFVGRIVPNKKIEDHIRLAEHYKRYVDSNYRFIFVGRHQIIPGYYAMIRALMVEYAMLPARFLFTGPVPDEDLATYYRTADAYVSLSEHEGFCVPLIEAMSTNVPVLAYSAGAVPETLGGAGFSFAPKDLELAAELLGMVVYDDEIRKSVLSGQRKRLSAFDDQQAEKHLDWLLSNTL